MPMSMSMLTAYADWHMACTLTDNCVTAGIYLPLRQRLRRHDARCDAAPCAVRGCALCTLLLPHSRFSLSLLSHTHTPRGGLVTHPTSHIGDSVEEASALSRVGVPLKPLREVTDPVPLPVPDIAILLYCYIVILLPVLPAPRCFASSRAPVLLTATPLPCPLPLPRHL
jgi:hypothetical protein